MVKVCRQPGMVGVTGNQTNCAKWFILLGSIPPRLRYLSKKRNWIPMKDEIRGVYSMHGLADIPEEGFDVEICFCWHGIMFAICEFKYNDDTREVFKVVRGHVFEGYALQAWLCETGQNGPKFLDGPKDQAGGGILPPFPALPNRNLSWSHIPGRLFRPQTNQSTTSAYNTTMYQPGRDTNVSQDHVLPQLLPAASTRMQGYSEDVDQVLTPHMCSYTTNLDPYEQHLGCFTWSVGDASDESDVSRTLQNTPELSSSSRTSSVSAIPDAYLPARSPSYRSFQTIHGSPYLHLNSSVSSSSSQYSPSSSRNHFGSTHVAQQDSASDEAYKIIIRHVPAGVTQKELSEQLDQKLPRYVRYQRPKQGEDNKWSVEFSKEEDAETAKERLHNLDLKGRKLKVHVAPPRRINNVGSNTSATSSSITSGPTIVDGSVSG